jgi:hypothetical protein
LLLAIGGVGAAHAAAQVTLATSNENPVAGGAAFSYTATIAADAAGANNLRFSLPLPSGALFQGLSLGGGAAGAFVCSLPSIGSNSSVSCDAELMAASTSATVTIVAAFDNELSGGVRTTVARLAFSGAGSPSTAQVQQTIVNNAAVTVSTTDAAGPTQRLRRLLVQNTGQSAAVLPSITTMLPAGAHVLRFDATRDLVDRCHFNPGVAEVVCTPQFLASNGHALTIVYGMPRRIFRDGFE